MSKSTKLYRYSVDVKVSRDVNVVQNHEFRTSLKDPRDSIKALTNDMVERMKSYHELYPDAINITSQPCNSATDEKVRNVLPRRLG